eukprot:3707818-Rhodomonas_salina.1
MGGVVGRGAGGRISSTEMVQTHSISAKPAGGASDTTPNPTSVKAPPHVHLPHPSQDELSAASSCSNPSHKALEMHGMVCHDVKGAEGVLTSLLRPSGPLLRRSARTPAAPCPHRLLSAAPPPLAMTEPCLPCQIASAHLACAPTAVA